MNNLLNRCKNGVLAVTTSAVMATAAHADAVADAGTALTGAQTQATSIITLGFAVVGVVAGLWVAIGLIKKLIHKAAS